MIIILVAIVTVALTICAVHAVWSAPFTALDKLERGIVSPMAYNILEHRALSMILDSKVSKLDMSWVDLQTKSGMERLCFALLHHNCGIEYYRDWFKHNTAWFLSIPN